VLEKAVGESSKARRRICLKASAVSGVMRSIAITPTPLGIADSLRRDDAAKGMPSWHYDSAMVHFG
jgi:hypothetical protein